VALERDQGQLWMVARSDHDELARLPQEVYASVETDSDLDGSDAVLTGVGLVYITAAVNAEPITFVPGDLPVAVAHTTGDLHDRLARALEYRQGRGWGQPLIVQDHQSTWAMAEVRYSRRGTQLLPPIEYGAGGQVLSVR
jgi:hypothetical protein